MEDEQVRLGDLFAVADDLLALADLEQDVLHLRPLGLQAAPRLRVVVGQIRSERAPDELRHRASQPRRQIAELLPRDAVDVLARPLQVLDAIDVAHQLLGARPPFAERADHDAPFPIGGEKSALLHHETRPGQSGEPQRGALHRRVEPGARQLEIRIVVEHRLQRFPELVALGKQEARALRVQPAAGLESRRPGRVLLPPEGDRLAAAGEGVRDAPLQRLRGRPVEVVHRPGRPRRFLALGRRGVGIRDVVIAVRFQGAGKERPERLVAGDRRREAGGSEEEGGAHGHAREERQGERLAHSPEPEDSRCERRCARLHGRGALCQQTGNLHRFQRLAVPSLRSISAS